MEATLVRTERHVVLTIQFPARTQRRTIEQKTIQAEDALTANMPDLGASATANFVEHAIEIDFCVDAGSIAELYSQITEVARVLEENGLRRSRTHSGLPLASATQAVPICA